MDARLYTKDSACRWLGLKRPVAFAVVLCIMLLAATATTRSGQLSASVSERPCQDVEDGFPQLACCGHRGARQLAPENTLSSFKRALQVGANCIELDVHRTRDGYLAVAHGRTVREKLLTPFPPGSPLHRMEAQDWSELKALDAGSWFRPAFKGERISLLQDVVKAFWTTPVQIVVELKYEECETSSSGVQVEPGTVSGSSSSLAQRHRLLENQNLLLEVEQSKSSNGADVRVLGINIDEAAGLKDPDSIEPSKEGDFKASSVQVAASGRYSKGRHLFQSTGPIDGSCHAPGVWEDLFADSIVSWLKAIPRPEPWMEPRLGIFLTSFNHILVDKVADALANHKGELGHLEDRIFGLAYIFGPKDNTTLDRWHDGVAWAALHDSLVADLAPVYKGKRQIISWVTDSVPLLERQVAMGVQGVTTNDPSLCPAVCQAAITYLSP